MLQNQIQEVDKYAPLEAGDPAADPRMFCRCLGQYATGIAVVTACSGEVLNGMTINSFSSLSLEPALVLFAGYWPWLVSVPGQAFTHGGEWVGRTGLPPGWSAAVTGAFVYTAYYWWLTGTVGGVIGALAALGSWLVRPRPSVKSSVYER